MHKKFSEEDVSIINNILKPYISSDVVNKMKCFLQHRTVTTFDHCLNVVCISYIISKFLTHLGFHINISMLLIGALLHDLYLYDWHTGRIRKEGIHGFSHPLIAKRNANKYFKLTDKTLNIIESHMFPLTLTHVPKSIEAFIVGISDKYCAIFETLFKQTLYTKKGFLLL